MSATPPGVATEARTPHRKALLILWLLIALYIANFATLSVLQNAAFETGAADLGNMNQAAWYTLHRGYPADSFAGHVITRLGGHVEPIFYLLAIPYALHQSADTLLIIQTVAIALGAIAAYMLARDVLASENAGLVFAFTYLLFPSLQAANLTEFHPVALAAPLLLFAFYYLQKGNQPAFLVFAFLAMSTKEDMSLLVVTLGLAAFFLSPRPRVPAASRLSLSPSRVAGLSTIGLGIGWFLFTVYVIIPHFSASGSNVLFERYAEVGGSPQGLVRTMLSDPLAVLARLFAPEKLSYLAGLLLSAGFLTLAAPWALVLAAPSLGINMLSNYGPMYSGLSHYSAPVAPFIIIGGVYGARSVAGFLQRRLRVPARRALLLILGWLLVVATIYQGLMGFTPLSMLYRVPRITAHNQLVTRFAQQIPADAVVSAQMPLHPHLSSRALIYPFPTINDAEYVLVDVTARPTMHPNDLKSTIQKLVSDDGFGVLDAADGYILLQRGVARADLPESFYTAFRVALPQPRYRVVADFGPSLRLLGYDIEDVDEGRQPWTRMRLYWQVNGPLPDDLRIYPFYLDDAGHVIEDTTQRPLVAALWYSPSRWQTGDTIRVETLAWPLGNHFRPAVGVVRGGDWSNQAARLPVQLVAPVNTSSSVRSLDGGTALELGRFQRRITTLNQVQPPAPQPATRLEANFGSEIRLLGYDLQGKIAPGETIHLTLYWQALTRPAVDYHTFAHIYNSAGQVAAQDDGVTGNTQPTTWWFPGQVISETRAIAIPPAVPAGLSPSITIGLYQLDTGARLPVAIGKSRTQGNTLTIQP
jgi:uncharacterized membrane protein